MSHSHEHGHMFGSTDQADSAGQPWEGRAFDENPFAGDDGTAPAAYTTSLAAFRALELDSDERPAAQAAVVDSIRVSRFLIPLLAEAGDVGVNAAGLVVDKTQELAIVTVEGPGGQRVLPVFSSVEAMQLWNADARPVPAEARRVALAAAADGADWVVIDPTSETEFILRRPALAAVAQDLPWQHNVVDDELRAVLEAGAASDPRVLGIRLAAGDPDARGFAEDLVIALVLPAGLQQDEIQQVIGTVSGQWAHHAIIGERIDSVRLAILAAD